MATIDLHTDDFSRTVTESEMVLVDFWASWCGPCRMFAPVFEQASERHAGIVFAKVDTEAESQLAVAARITSIPTLMAFKQGQLVYAHPGALPAQALEQLIGELERLTLVDTEDAEEHAS